MTKTKEEIDINKENEQLKEKLNKFEEMFKAMQAQIVNLQKPVVNVVDTKSEIEKNMVYIGSNIMDKIIISTNKDGSAGVTLYGHKKPIGVTFNKISSLLEVDKNRKLFEKGLLYFADTKWYELFSVDTKIILNDDNLIEMLQNKDGNLMAKLIEITDNKSDEAVVHSVLFRIAYLIKNNKVEGFDYNNMQILQNFFGVDVSKTMAMLDLLAKE